jgi:hypothetical protein
MKEGEEQRTLLREHLAGKVPKDGKEKGDHEHEH